MLENFGSFVSGYNTGTDAIRKRNQELADQQGQRDNAVFTALANSDDPDVRAAAVTGLLTGNHPAGVFGKYFDKVQQHPAYDQIKQLVSTPVTTTVPGHVANPDESFAGASAPTAAPTPAEPPPSLAAVDDNGSPASSAHLSPLSGPPPSLDGAAAASTTSTPQATPQAPPPVAAAPPATPGSAWAPPALPFIPAHTETHPRQVFLSPVEKYRQEALAKAGAVIDADIAAYTPYLGRPGAVEQVMRERTHHEGGEPNQSIAGEAPDEKGVYSPTFATYDRARGVYNVPGTQQPIQGFRPRASTGSKSLGTFFERAAKQLGYANGSSVPPEQVDAVETAAQKMQQAEVGGTATARGTAMNNVDLDKPIGTAAAQRYATTKLDDGSPITAATTPRQLSNIHATPLSDQDMASVGGMQRAETLLSGIEQEINTVFPDAKPGVFGRLGSQLTLGKKMLTADPDLATLHTQLTEAAPIIAQIARESGRVPATLIQQWQSTMAHLEPSVFGGDTRASALAKLQEIQRFLQEAQTVAPGPHGQGTGPVGQPRTGTPAAGATGAAGATPPQQTPTPPQGQPGHQ